MAARSNKRILYNDMQTVFQVTGAMTAPTANASPRKWQTTRKAARVVGSQVLFLS
jgi:hypothetical protein